MNVTDSEEYTDESAPAKNDGESNSYSTKTFNIDYTKVYAPYVRIVSKRTGKKGDTVITYDIRLCQPNFECMDTDEIHTLSHLMSEILHASFDNIIDIYPMGSRTGFYLTMFEGVSEKTIAKVMIEVMQKIATWNGPVPRVSKELCGNFQDHELMKAKKRAMMFIGGIMSKGYMAAEGI